MTRKDFLVRWRSRRQEFQRVGALVEGAKLVDEVLADVEEFLLGEDSDLLTLTEAARESGYSADHLGRLVKAGAIPNSGRTNAPRIRRKDLPRKASRLRSERGSGRLVDATPVQIARAVVTSKPGDPR